MRERRRDVGRINVLGFDVANLIAAGEVVDRPSSVVKELLENAIDAGADTITVEIQRGGVAFIRVSDNGCGMDADDLPVAILRHATSKIHEADDLTHISSLGFRGEALAAIASVSRLRIFSKPHSESLGAILTAEGGEVLDITETGCADGTTVVVEDLFFNVPARRKFLKKDTTEAVAVGNVVEKIALSRPDISIKYICDGEMKFTTCGDGELYSAIYAVFGKDTAKRTVKVAREADGISVTGFVSEPDFIKSNRNMENFFINGRYVKSKTAIAAVEQAYRTRIPQDKFPFCVLNIDINPTTVDVNVHPAKLEVKFTNERVIFEAVYYAVLNALESEVVRPELVLTREKPRSTESTPTYNTAVGTARAASENAHGAARTFGDNFKASTTADADSTRQTKKDSFWIDGAEARRLLGAFVPADTRIPKGEQTKIDVTPRDAFDTRRVADGESRGNAPVAARESMTAKVSTDAGENTVAETNGRVPGSVLSNGTGSIASERADEDARSVSAQNAQLERAKPNESRDAKPLDKTTNVPTNVATNEPTNVPLNSRDECASPDEAEEVPEYIILGEAYNCYVIVQLEDRLVFVDKHAAHERIIFDELVRSMKKQQRGSQLLLVPITVPMLEIEADALREYEENVRSIGFDFTLEQNGNRMKAVITALPEILTPDEATELFRTLASRLSDIGAGADAAAEEFFSARLFQSACKAAIKGGRIYDMAHIRWICDRLFIKPKAGESVIRTCPHGRPVAFEVKRSSIDRQFARLT